MFTPLFPVPCTVLAVRKGKCVETATLSTRCFVLSLQTLKHFIKGLSKRQPPPSTKSQAVKTGRNPSPQTLLAFLGKGLPPTVTLDFPFLGLGLLYLLPHQVGS